MRFRFFALLIVLLVPLPARAAVVTIGNYTDTEIAFSIAEPNAKARTYKLPSNHVVPVYVTGPADVTFTANARETKLRVDMYNAYLFIPDRQMGFRLEGLEQPGDALERDGRAEPNPIPRDPPVKIPVTLLVDDVDPRADKFWQAELRKRLEEAAVVIEKAAGVRFEVAGFDTWKSDPDAKSTSELLTGLEKVVRAKEGTLVVGYTSRKIDEKTDPAFGQSRALNGRHILIREWTPRNESERMEVLVHFLAQALGGVGSPDPGSALRPKIGDGYALRVDGVVRLDPLNALLLNLWADERRRDAGVTINTLSAVNRARITRLYKALLKAAPGDLLAIDYLGTLDRDVAKNPDPMPKVPERPAVKVNVRDEIVRAVVKAVTARAKQNAALGATALRGDELTAAYVHAAADRALHSPGPEMVSAYLIALGVALDETGALADDATTASAVKNAETEEERKERLAVLGNPTLAGRRDLCRRFFLGCAIGELLPPDTAENVAVGRALFDLHRPANLCLPVLAAELAGVTYARAVQQDVEVLQDAYRTKFSALDYLPPMKDLRDGLSTEKFEEVYGDSSNARFVAVLTDIRKRLKAMKAYK